MRIRPLHALAPAALGCLALALVVLTLSQPAVAQTDGVPHVKNGAAPTGGVETLTLTELWRRGGEDDEEILFGIISDAEVGPDGNIYLLDAQLNEIKVLSPEGELLRSIGRQGEGPGEFQNAQQFTFLPDGNIGVAQVFPGKLIGLKPDGSPGKDLEPGKTDPTAGGFFVLVNAESGGGNLVVTGIEMNFDQTTMSQKRHYFVRSYGMDGAQKVEFLGTERTWVFDDSFKFLESDNDFVWRRFGVSAKGQVVAAVQPLEYALNVYSAEGKLERVIERQYEILDAQREGAPALPEPDGGAVRAVPQQADPRDRGPGAGRAEHPLRRRRHDLGAHQPRLLCARARRARGLGRLLAHGRVREAGQGQGPGRPRDRLALPHR